MDTNEVRRMTCTNCKRETCPVLDEEWMRESPDEALLDCERAKSVALTAALIAEADQLERWANESSTGGWSTHQVESMRRRADELRRIATGTVRR